MSQVDDLLALVAAAREASRADDLALAALRKAMRPGRQVRWRHGGHWRSAEVVAVNGIRYSTANVRVNNPNTGREYDVPASTLVMDL